jgi:hypothetical protein
MWERGKDYKTTISVYLYMLITKEKGGWEEAFYDSEASQALFCLTWVREIPGFDETTLNKTYFKRLLLPFPLRARLRERDSGTNLPDLVWLKSVLSPYPLFLRLILFSSSR